MRMFNTEKETNKQKKVFTKKVQSWRPHRIGNGGGFIVLGHRCVAAAVSYENMLLTWVFFQFVKKELHLLPFKI